MPGADGDGTLHPADRLVPMWMTAPWRVFPGVSPNDLIRLLAMSQARSTDTVGHRIGTVGPSRTSFWEPLCIAALNTQPESASAEALWRVVRNTLSSGDNPLLPRFVNRDLTTDLVNPSILVLRQLGTELRLKSKLNAIEHGGGRVTRLHFDATSEPIGAGDQVVLAVTPDTLAQLLPGLSYPQESRAIITAHFVLDPPAEPKPILTSIFSSRPLLLLTRDNLATVSAGAANDLVGMPCDEIARQLWLLVAQALCRSTRVPIWNVMKFRHGTHAHTPAEEARRPLTHTSWENLFLAGDWTRTNQAATMDGAIQSGYVAADAVLRC